MHWLVICHTVSPTSPPILHLSFSVIWSTRGVFCYFCRKGNCKRITLGIGCEVGRRQRTFHILCGSVLSVWSKLETLLAGQPGANSKIQIVRCRKSDDSRIVGERSFWNSLKPPMKGKATVVEISGTKWKGLCT